MLGDLTGRYLATRLINDKRNRFFDERGRSLKFDDLDIPSAFDEAVAFFLEKGVISKNEFKKLSAEARRKSFSLVADSRVYILAQIKEMLSRFLKEGGTVGAFRDEMFGFFEQAGVTARNPFYYDLVFQNNIQESLARGKDAIYEEADDEEFPFRQFLTVGDDRVRTSHAEIDGFTAPKNDPIWLRLKVPLDHGCRCSISLVHKDEGATPWDPANYPSLTGRGFGFVN